MAYQILYNIYEINKTKRRDTNVQRMPTQWRGSNWGGSLQLRTLQLQTPRKSNDWYDWVKKEKHEIRDCLWLISNHHINYFSSISIKRREENESTNHAWLWTR